MKRVLTPELIDLLPASDPRIARSRRDLIRLNRLNRSDALMATLLRQTVNGIRPQTLTDLGSGDGLFCLDVARRLHPAWTNMAVQLLDQQPVVKPETVQDFARLDWAAVPVKTDLFTASDWAHAKGQHVVMANLVLHHFPAESLTGLFQTLAANAQAFVAVEPGRGWRQLLFSRCLWLMGCGEVSRHDGPASVRAGFRGLELSALWPDRTNWKLTERSGGPFSHVFVAQRRAG